MKIFNAFIITGIVCGAASLFAGTSVRIGLQASNGQWVCAELTGARAVVANRGNMGPWETFNITDLNGGALMSGDRLAIQSADSRFFCAESGGGSTVVANRLSPYSWEEFRLVRAAGPGAVVPGDTVFVQTGHGQYLRAVNGGGGVVDGQGYGMGAWETFTVQFAELPEQTSAAMVDVNSDGILDEVIRPGNHKFKSYIGNWYTECYDYGWYPVNSYFSPWGFNFGNPFGDSPGFSHLWSPSLFWVNESYYSYCFTYVEPTVEFEADFSSTYHLYRDSSGSTSYNPANWQLVFSATGLWAGIHTVPLGTVSADSAYQDQFFLVKLGKTPPSNGLNYAAFFSGDKDFGEFVQHAVETLDPGVVDPDVVNQPEIYDAIEEVGEQIMREADNLPSKPKVDMFRLLARTAVVIAVIQALDQWPMSYCVYRKKDAIGDKAYIGRTAGPGMPQDVVARRDVKHNAGPMRAIDNYQNAEWHSYITTYGASFFGYHAMRGREQIVMDNVEYIHNRRSSYQVSRGVRANHEMRLCYYFTSNLVWPSLFVFTRDTWGSHWYDVVNKPFRPDKKVYSLGTIQFGATQW